MKKMNSSVIKPQLIDRYVKLPLDSVRENFTKNYYRNHVSRVLLGPNSTFISYIVDSIGKQDELCGWRKQEELLRFIIDISAVNQESLYDDLTSFIRVFWDNLSGFFGVNAASELERYLETRVILQTVIESTDEKYRKQIILDIFDALKDATYLASGAQRYAPLAVFVINLFQGQNAYNLNKALHGSEVERLLKNHLFYNRNAMHEEIQYKEAEYFFPKIPTFQLNLPPFSKGNEELLWLDVGCAPKANGSPTLELLKMVFAQCPLFNDKNITFNFFGTDIFFPYYYYDKHTQTVKTHEVFDTLRGNIREAVYNDITYLNAKFPIYDATSKSFLNSKEKIYNFISACKVMHNFADDGAAETVLASTVNVNGELKSISWDGIVPRSVLSKKQQIVAKNLLRLLKVGGYLFLDLSNPYKDSEKYLNHNVFFVITRLSDCKFKLYDFIVPYDPDSKKVYPHAEYVLQSQAVLAKRFNVDLNMEDGLRKAFLDDYIQLQQLMRQLDILVYYSQTNEYISNRYLKKASAAFRDGKLLSNACEIYLEGVKEIIYSKEKDVQHELTAVISKTLSKIITIERSYFVPKNQQINVMIIGCGGAARDSYIPGSIMVDSVEIRSIIIPGDKKSIEESIDQIKSSFEMLGVDQYNAFTNIYTQMLVPLTANGIALDYDKDWSSIEKILNVELAQKKINAIIIGSSEGYHHKYIEWALANKLHIACDKPLTSRIGVSTDFVVGREKENVTVASELLHDYDQYIARLDELEKIENRRIQFEILTKKRYSMPILKIQEALKKSNAKSIRIYTADGWWLTPAQLARSDIFTMYGMDGNRSDGGKLVHTAAHFLDLGIMFAREGRGTRDITNMEVSTCFVRGYDSAVRSNKKAWLDVEALGAGISDDTEKNVLANNYFSKLKKLPEVNLMLQIKLSLTDGDYVYIQLMGLHENLAKMANKSLTYKERFQSRTKVDLIFIQQDNDKIIEYKRFGKINDATKGNIVGGSKHQELTIDGDMIDIPYEDMLDTKPVVKFLENVKVVELSYGKNNVQSSSHLRQHKYDIKLLAAIYKSIAENYIHSMKVNQGFAANRQVCFNYSFQPQKELGACEPTETKAVIPYFIMDKVINISAEITEKVRKIRELTNYGIISLQSVSFYGGYDAAREGSSGFEYLDNLIALVQYSYNEITDEKLVDWQINLQKDISRSMIIAQIVFYGIKHGYKYIAAQLQLMAFNVTFNKGDKSQEQTLIHSLEISQGPFALLDVSQNVNSRQIKVQGFFSKELMKRMKSK